MTYLRLAVLVCIALVSANATRAQLPDMQPLAAGIAQAVTKSKLKSVIVVDFSGPGDKLTELGRTLADRCSTAFAKSNGKFSVAERTQFKPAKGPDGNPAAVRQTI